MTEPAASTTDDTALVHFFDPHTSGADPRGLTLSDILSKPDNYFERSHNYIQYLFPLPEGSVYNYDAWIIEPKDYDAFRARSKLRESLEGAFSRAAAFYGLEIKHHENETTAGAKFSITRGPNFTTAKQNWVKYIDHNHLRITRILRCLRVLSLPELAAAFHHFLSTDAEVLSKVSDRTRQFWSRAAERPLHMPPHVPDGSDEGIDWLKQRTETTQASV